MRVLTWKLHGKMAHFRKFYSNSTALSYYIPPVTTIKGMLAGLLGMERDSYYELFSTENCQIAIGVASKIKKTTQTMNLLKVESLNDLNGAGKNRTQNNTEWIMPHHIRTSEVCYSIAMHHVQGEIMEQLAQCLCAKEPVYRSKGISVALGAAQCLGWMSEGMSCEAQEKLVPNEPIAMMSAIPVESILSLEKKGLENISIIKEETITQFDKNRYLTEEAKKDILVSISGAPFMVQLKPDIPYIEVQGSNMMFLG